MVSESSRRPLEPGSSWAVITGASGGIGFDLAREAAADGYHLILVARNSERLAEADDKLRAEFDCKTFVIELDLSRPGAAGNLVGQIGHRPVNVLINNAGFATHGKFWENDGRELSEEVGLNIAALTELTRLLLPAMVERGSGYILNLASIAAFAPGPMMAVYYATKAYVLSFSIAIANELEGSGVIVSALCPGPTKTGFAARAKVEKTRAFSGRNLSSKSVAKIGYRSMKMGKVVVVPGRVGLIQTWLVRLVSRQTAARFVRGVQE